MRFFIEQIALCPPDPVRAIALLKLLGLDEWAHDVVVASGSVYAEGPVTNRAVLAFNYQATRGITNKVASSGGNDINPSEAKPLELEVLHYTEGRNWMDVNVPSVSHLGMHCSAQELAEWTAKFEAFGIKWAQNVLTKSHTNPAIAGKRWYNYRIFHTRPILGVDLKFIVRHGTPPASIDTTVEA